MAQITLGLRSIADVDSVDPISMGKLSFEICKIWYEEQVSMARINFRFGSTTKMYSAKTYFP